MNTCSGGIPRSISSQATGPKILSAVSYFLHVRRFSDMTTTTFFMVGQTMVSTGTCGGTS